MKPTLTLFKIRPLIAMVLACAAFAFAAGEKERMIQRAPQIVAMKSSGVIGEKADGYLGIIKAGADQSVVNAENADRKAVYAEIAKSSGASPTSVARRRALQIIEQASPGDWLQAADGSWYQKK
ncbi:MAG: DUF1318 domain-containing protein [Kiritimatiellaceae bacterium]|nr:DUF1318 domain-containing protein [Kiritimatiellaceae bacterium]